MNDRYYHNISGVNWFLFTTTILQLLFTQAVIIINSFLSYNRPNENFYLFINQILTIFLPVAAYAVLKNVDVKEFFRLKRLPAKSVIQLIGIGFFGQFIGQFLNIIIVCAMMFFRLPMRQDPPFDGGWLGFFIATFTIAIMPGIFEELLIRGVALRAYEKRGPVSAILLTAFLFSLMHLDIKNIVALFFLGVVFSYVVLKSGSIYASMILHVTNNFTGVLVYTITGKIGNNVIAIIVLLAMSLVSLIVFIPLLAAFRRSAGKKLPPQRNSVKGEIVQSLFNLPVILIIITFIIFQAYSFGAFQFGQ